jgi:hypothetical protein
VVRDVGHASGSFSEVGGCSGSYARGWERSSGGGADKMNGRVLFYSRALRGGNTGLHKEGERKVMARRGGRASMLAWRRGTAAKGDSVKGTRAAFVRTSASG